MNVMCLNNCGYKWTELPEGCFKGYLQIYGNPKPLRGEEALRHLSQAESFEDFQALLKELDGLYAAVLRREDGAVWAAVDIARSTPLYYSADGRFLSDSSPAVREALGLPREAADPSALEELFYCGFISGFRTAYAEIAQIDAGQALEFSPSGEIRESYYYAHIQKTREIGREETMRLFQQVSDQVFDEAAAAIAGRPVVLSLSGGYDSRYVACMLKRRGVEDVSCYTYGRKDSFEVQVSEKIAKALGWRWICVEHTDERVMGILDETGQAYARAFEQYDYAFFIQNFPAVRYLHETGWFKPGSVFLTGLSNDIPAGSHTLQLYETFSSCFSEETLASAATESALLNTAQKPLLDALERQRRGLNLSFTTYQEFSNSVECLQAIRRYSRGALHMNCPHEYFGYEYLLPCWNRKLLEFWYSMPLEYRFAQNLFEEWITAGPPAQYGLGQKKTVLGYSSFRGWERTKARGRLALNRLVCMPLGIALREKQDFNNFSPLQAAVFRQIHQKRLIKFRNSDFNHVFTLSHMEQLYGPRCLEKRGTSKP